MAVTLVFWREIKGSRVKVLLNLCAAIACTCILAILEGSARNKEVRKIFLIRRQYRDRLHTIGHLHYDDVVFLKLPKFFRLLLSCVN